MENKEKNTLDEGSKHLIKVNPVFKKDDEKKWKNNDLVKVQDEDLSDFEITGKSGDLKQGKKETKLTANNRIYVVDRIGKLYTKPNPIPAKYQTEWKHSSILGGKEVQTAGHLSANEGIITKIDNNSGHYQPSVPAHLQAVYGLYLRGMIDKNKTKINFAKSYGQLSGINTVELMIKENYHINNKLEKVFKYRTYKSEFNSDKESNIENEKEVEKESNEVNINGIKINKEEGKVKHDGTCLYGSIAAMEKSSVFSVKGKIIIKLATDWENIVTTDNNKVPKTSLLGGDLSGLPDQVSKEEYLGWLGERSSYGGGYELQAYSLASGKPIYVYNKEEGKIIVSTNGAPAKDQNEDLESSAELVLIWKEGNSYDPVSISGI